MYNREQGLSLVEAVVSAVVFGAAISAIIPSFMAAQVETSRNQMKLEAVSLSQQVLDVLRRADILTLPGPNTTAPISTLPNGLKITLPDGTLTNELTALKIRAVTYDAKIIYCETASMCDPNTRQIKVQVFQAGNNQSLYEAETLYTRLQ
jgi:type II secretory pathway pseudopilin PulG